MDTEPKSEPAIRTFIAIPLEGALKDRLAQLQTRLKSTCPGLTLADARNLHLTLQFLGDRPQDELAEIGRVMLSVAIKKRIFNVLLEGLGVFPTLRHPRVLWIGMTPQDDVIELASLLQEDLLRRGLSLEQKPFRPHLTLGRFKHPQQPAISLRPFLSQRCGTLQVDKMVLYRSSLTSAGAIHTPLATAPLAAAES